MSRWEIALYTGINESNKEKNGFEKLQVSSQQKLKTSLTAQTNQMLTRIYNTEPSSER
jgi:hypothetical protein